MEIPVSGSPQKAQVLLQVPPHLEALEGEELQKEQLPLLVDVYGGPGFQKVDKKWQNFDFGAYMAASLGIVYAVVDPRGSGFQVWH